MKRAQLVLLLSLALAAMPRTLSAQGCSQCRETVGQSTARMQSGYRKAILLLVAAGAGVFGGTLVLLKRFRE